MSSNKQSFNKENLDMYLKEVAKEFRKINGKKMRAEIILIGGASILANYGFREMTTDMDAIIRAASAMHEAINRVGDKYNLPNGWLNSDFVKTDSYSSKLIEVSKHYRTFSNIVDIRTVSGEYLIAMKLISARKYKNDLSDVIGILKEHKISGDPITYERIDKALNELYGGWDKISDDTKMFIEEVTNNDIDYDEYFTEKKKEEFEAKETLIDFEGNYPGVLKRDNLDDILKIIKIKKDEQEKNIILRSSNDDRDR